MTAPTLDRSPHQPPDTAHIDLMEVTPPSLASGITLNLTEFVLAKE